MEPVITVNESFRSAVPEVSELEDRVRDFDDFVSEFIIPLRQRIIGLIEEGKTGADDELTDFGICLSPQDHLSPKGYLMQYIIDEFVLGFGDLSIESSWKYRFVEDSKLISKGEPEERFKKLLIPMREARVKMFNAAISNMLGDDYKALYLFAYYHEPTFHTLEKNGNWDYVDMIYNDFRPAESDRDSVEKIQRELNWQIVNPWAIDKENIRYINGIMKDLMKKNKTTRFIKWKIPGTPPSDFEPGSYDLVHLNDDYGWSDGKYHGLMVALDSVKKGGWLVVPFNKAKKIMEISDSVRPALVSRHLDYNILEKS